MLTPVAVFSYGAGMAKTPPIGVRLDPEAKAEIERAARDDARSVSSLISKIVNEWLANRKKGRPGNGPKR